MKSKIVKSVVLFILILLVIPVVGYSAGEKNLSMAAGPIGGAFYPISGGIASIVNREVEGVNISVQVTAGGVENTRLVGTGQADLGLISADQGLNSLASKGIFEGEALKLEALGALHPTVMQIVTLKKNNITTFTDLIGKKVAVGEPGGGASENFDKMLEAAGLTHDDIKTVYVSYEQSVDQIADGIIDATVILAGAPAPAVQSLAASHEIAIVNISEDFAEKIKVINPSFNLETFEPGFFPGVQEECHQLVMRIQFVVRSGMDEDLAYEITKAVYGNLEELGKYHSSAKLISLEEAHKTTVPLNPGAEKYFREIGNIK